MAFLKAQWHADIVNRALDGFAAELERLPGDYDVSIHDVPGAFELPLLAQQLSQRGEADAVVAAALVVDGGIYRHEFVAHAVVNGLMQAQLTSGVPTFSLSLTPHQFQPTAEHVAFFTEHFRVKGAEAARAVHATLNRGRG